MACSPGDAVSGLSARLQTGKRASRRRNAGDREALCNGGLGNKVREMIER